MVIKIGKFLLKNSSHPDLTWLWKAGWAFSLWNP